VGASLSLRKQASWKKRSITIENPGSNRAERELGSLLFMHHVCDGDNAVFVRCRLSFFGSQTSEQDNDLIKEKTELMPIVVNVTWGTEL
jgi:hypothetical protein